MCLAPFSGCWPQVAAVYICVCPNLTLLDTIFHGWELQKFRDCMRRQQISSCSKKLRLKMKAKFLLKTLSDKHLKHPNLGEESSASSWKGFYKTYDLEDSDSIFRSKALACSNLACFLVFFFLTAPKLKFRMSVLFFGGKHCQFWSTSQNKGS